MLSCVKESLNVSPHDRPFICRLSSGRPSHRLRPSLVFYQERGQHAERSARRFKVLREAPVWSLGLRISGPKFSGFALTPTLSRRTGEGEKHGGPRSQGVAAALCPGLPSCRPYRTCGKQRSARHSKHHVGRRAFAPFAPSRETSALSPKAETQLKA